MLHKWELVVWDKISSDSIIYRFRKRCISDNLEVKMSENKQIFSVDEILMLERQAFENCFMKWKRENTVFWNIFNE